MVSYANYISPQNTQYLEPQFIAPLAGPSALSQVKSAFGKVGDAFSKLRGGNEAPVPAPMTYMSPVAAAPVYASGVAMPAYATQPFFVSKYKRFSFPFITKALTLGISAVDLPDPVVVAPPVPTMVAPTGISMAQPAMAVAPGGYGKGGMAPQPQYAQQPPMYGGQQLIGGQQYTQQQGQYVQQPQQYGQQPQQYATGPTTGAAGQPGGPNPMAQAMQQTTTTSYSG